MRRIRTCSPSPGAKTTYLGKDLKVYSAHVVTNLPNEKNFPGQIVEVNKAELIVATGNSGYIALDTLQFAGKSKLPIKEILRGHQFKIGEQLI